MDEINTNLSDYTIDELFSLLDITINTNSTYDELVKTIKTNTDKYITNFTRMNKPNIVTFFKNVQDKLLNSSTEKSVKDPIVITYDHNYNYGRQNANTEGSDNMFNSNNGAGNPINRKTVTKLYNIDSRFRDNYNNTTSTNFSVTIPEEQKGVIEMKLCDLELPTTYYPFNTAYNNNYMWVKITFANHPTYYLYIYVPDGNYYFTSFINIIQNYFSYYSELSNITILFNLSFNNPSGIGEGTGLIQIGLLDDTSRTLNSAATNLKITGIEVKFTAPPIPNQTSTLLITSSSAIVANATNNVSNDLSLADLYSQTSNIALNQQLGWSLGFRNAIYTTTPTSTTITDVSGVIISTTSTTSTTNFNIKSESILDIIGPRYLYLSVDDHRFSINSNFKPCNPSNLPGTIMARLSLKGSPFNIQTQNDFSVYSEPRYYFGPVNISKLDIKILDEYGRIVSINNNDFSFTLRLTVIYSAT